MQAKPTHARLVSDSSVLQAYQQSDLHNDGRQDLPRRPAAVLCLIGPPIGKYKDVLDEGRRFQHDMHQWKWEQERNTQYIT